MPKKPKIDSHEALVELARRKGILARPGEFKLEDYLFDKQLAFVRDPARFKVAVTTRRAGKSVSCVTDLLHTATSIKTVASAATDPISLYITLSRSNAKRLVWPLFKKLNRQFQLQGDANESELSLTFPNGHRIYLLGAADKTAIEDFRGMPVIKAYIDEAQSFPEYLRPMIDDSLEPTLSDYNGQLILIGTPGPVPTGYFHEISHNPEWSHHAWSSFDNPKLPYLAQGITHQANLNQVLKRRGVTIDDPSIQREYFGRWVADTKSLVYHYNGAINHYEALPEGKWTFILGVDLGFKDADALAVLAYSESSPNTYLLEEDVQRGQDLTALCDKIDRLIKRYDITKIVVDTGGLGKKITEEISRRWSVPMVAAEKQRKHEFIELVNDSLRSGRFKVKANSLFAHDSMKLEWEFDKFTETKKVISNRFHSDICDAVLYAWRESYSYTYKAPAVDPEYGTKAWSDAEADKMYQHEFEKAMEAEEAKGNQDEPYTPTTDNIQSLSRPKLRYQQRFQTKKTPKFE